MGSWDCYCAICGSTISGAIISEKPRTARFHKRRAEERREAAAAAAGQDAPVYEESDEDSDDNESLDSYDEEYSYDPAILSDEDIEWTSSLHILGFNPDANNVTKAFVAGPGFYGDYVCSTDLTHLSNGARK
ncbi:F-box domain [Neofusicoccum parvum]|uniref:F-box domain n=1 Tax=Neofusicoccum parvum TaxID=310453 RepID=A0ACB5RZH9_9PEZI|nr:F-box domain [Neofusicoccum parvum]